MNETNSTAENRAPVRRVGTFTLGLALIVGGALLLAKIVWPGLNVLLLLQFSPVVLIALGAEMLLAAAKPGEKLRYDWLSIFVSFLLICGAGCAAAVPSLLNYYGPAHDLAENRLSRELTDAAYAALKDACPQVNDLSVNLALSRAFPASDAEQLTLDDLSAANLSYASAYATLTGPYTSAEDFAADCRAVLQAAKSAGLPFTSWWFDTLHGTGEIDTRYALSLDGPWKENADAQTLARSVEVTYWYDDGYYDSLEDAQLAMDGAAQGEDSDAYQQGLAEGQAQGYDEGYAQGYEAGLAEAQAAWEDES